MKIAEVVLHTQNIHSIKTFYGNLLGLAVLTDQHSSNLSFQAGASILSFSESSSTENSFYHVAFTIPTNMVEAAKVWLNQRGIPLFSKDGQDEFHIEPWNATALYFYDPDDNLIEFIAHHTLDNATTEAFGPSHLLRVSELGLPVHDVPETVEMLTTALQLNLWGGDGQQFAPLGDAEGALIVVDKQRPWFPDGRTAGIFDTNVRIKGSYSTSVLLENNLYRIRSIVR